MTNKTISALLVAGMMVILTGATQTQANSVAATPQTAEKMLVEYKKIRPGLIHSSKRVKKKVRRGITCRASWYHEGSVTATGERYRPDGLTAAHRRLPFGTRLLVKSGNRSVVVRINDRGPYIHGRCLDLSRGAARKLRMLNAGVKTVNYRVIR